MMGYFPNGTSAEIYEAKFCERCVHQTDKNGNGCVVWLAHLLNNYDECDKPDSILHMLIPLSKDGLDNEKCTMFHRGNPTHD